MIPAAVESWRTSVCRYARIQYVAKATPTRRSVAALAMNITAVSFLLMERSRSSLISAPAPAIRPDDPGELEESRADSNVGALGRLDVDRESDTMLLDREADHSPALRELLDVADRQDARGGEGSENRFEVLSLGAADVDHLTQQGVLDAGDSLDDDRFGLERTHSRGLLHKLAGGIVTQDPDRYRGVGGAL